MIDVMVTFRGERMTMAEKDRRIRTAIQAQKRPSGRKGAASKAPSRPEPPSEESAEAKATLNASAIVEICVAAGVPGMAAGMIREGVTLEVARERAGGAQAIRTCCREMAKINPAIFAPAGPEAAAATFVQAFEAGKITVDMVRTIVLDRCAEMQSPEIRSAIAPDARSAPYDDGWKAAFAAARRSTK